MFQIHELEVDELGRGVGRVNLEEGGIQEEDREDDGDVAVDDGVFQALHEARIVGQAGNELILEAEDESEHLALVHLELFGRQPRIRRPPRLSCPDTESRVTALVVLALWPHNAATWEAVVAVVLDVAGAAIPCQEYVLGKDNSTRVDGQVLGHDFAGRKKRNPMERP